MHIEHLHASKAATVELFTYPSKLFNSILTLCLVAHALQRYSDGQNLECSTHRLFCPSTQEALIY